MELHPINTRRDHKTCRLKAYFFAFLSPEILEATPYSTRIKISITSGTASPSPSNAKTSAPDIFELELSSFSSVRYLFQFILCWNM